VAFRGCAHLCISVCFPTKNAGFLVLLSWDSLTEGGNQALFILFFCFVLSQTGIVTKLGKMYNT